MNAPLSEQQLAAVRRALRYTTRTASPETVQTVAEFVDQARDTEPGSAGWRAAVEVLVEQTGTVIRRLMDAEARIAELEAELAKYVGHEPTLAEEALYAHEQQVRARVAQDVNRADRPVFAKSEDPELVVKTTRAIDICLIEMGPAAPYWVPEAGESR